MVETAPIERNRPITRTRSFGASLEADVKSVLTARIAGRIEAIELPLGAEVPSGQIVVRLENAELRGLASAARARLDVARARIRGAEVASERTKSALERREQLGRKGAASAEDLAEARAAAGAARADLALAQAEAAAAKAEWESARARLGYTRLGAEVEGMVVGEVHARAGDAVAVGDPIVTLVRPHPLRAVVRVSESDHRFVREGLKARLTTSAWPEQVFEARLRHAAAAYDEATRLRTLELEVPNPDGKLAPGMFAGVELDIESRADATVVPLAALTRRESVEGVFGVKDETAHWVPVRIGLRTSKQVQLLDDIPYERIIVLGQRLVDDGAKVRIPEVTR